MQQDLSPIVWDVLHDSMSSSLSIYVLLGLALLQCRVRSLPKYITIGGLFGDDELDTTENAFKYSVYKVDHERLLGNTEIEYDTKILSTTDTFKSSKLVCSQVMMGTAALFGPQSHDLASFTNSLCSSLHIPHLEFREDSNLGPMPEFSINLHPSVQQLAKAYLDVIEFYNMKEILIIYGNKEGLVKMQIILRTVTADTTRNVFMRQVDSKSMRPILKEAKKKSWTNIVADLSVSDTAILLKTALQEGMIDPYHHFIITTLDLEAVDLSDYKYNYVNLTGFRLVDPDNIFTRQIINDMYYYEENTGLKLLNRREYHTIPYQSALIYDAVLLFARALGELDRSIVLQTVNVSCQEELQWKSGFRFYDFLTKAEIRGLTGDIRLQQGRRMNFKLDIMQLRESGLEKSGSWTYESGVNLTSKYYKDSSLFGNKTLVVTTLLAPPYVMIKESSLDKLESDYDNNDFEGFCIDLLKEIAKINNFEYKIVPVRDKRYGIRSDETGEWDGLIRELIDRKADMAVAALTINYEREQYIDFTKPFLNLGISILYNVPKKEKPGLFQFLNPLAIEIWIYVIAAYLIVSFSIFVLARFSPYEWYNPHPCNPETDTVQNTFSLSNSFWFTVGTLMQQGSDINPRAVSTRIVGGTWWFFTLIIISSYTANLAAFLTVERMDSPIESAEDLAKQTEIEYGTLNSGSTFTFFKDSKIEIFQQMWNFMVSKSKEKNLFVDTYEEGIQRVKEANGKYAFLMESTSIDYVTERDCDLKQIGGLLDSKGFGIGVPMGSPLREKLSMAILHLQEEGRIQVLYNKWWKSTAGSCNRLDPKGKSKALGVESVGGIFIVLMGGLSLAIIVAIIEFICKSKKNAREDRQSLCSEMAEELRFAVRCHGSSKKPKTKPSVRSKANSVNAPLTGRQRESPNGMLQLREMRKSPVAINKEFHFGQGGYLHVDYSDTET